MGKKNKYKKEAGDQAQPSSSQQQKDVETKPKPGFGDQPDNVPQGPGGSSDLQQRAARQAQQTGPPQQQGQAQQSAPPQQQRQAQQSGPPQQQRQAQQSGPPQQQWRQPTQQQPQLQQRGPQQQKQREHQQQERQQLIRQEAGAIVKSLPNTGPIKRGTIGRPGQVEANYLNIDMAKMPSTAYHYDVKITPERPKKFYRAAFEKFRVQYLGGLVAAFDGRSSCYSVDKLSVLNVGKEVEVMDPNGRGIHYTIEIKETDNFEIDLSSLRSYMTSKIYDKPMRALQCLEVVLAAPCHQKAIRAGRSFFKKSQNEPRRELFDGYEALVGLYQTLVLGDKPCVNVDISHKSFPIALSVIEYLEKYGYRNQINANTDLSNSMRSIMPFLKGINVVYKPPDCFGSSPRLYKVNGLTLNPASKQKFQYENENITIADYFRKRGYPLKFPNLYCLHVGPPAKNIYLPMEFCSIEEGQALNRKDGERQVAQMIKYAATSTNERKRKIVDLLEYFQHNSDPTICRFGIQIGLQFIVVPTRLLQSPQIEYNSKIMEPVFNGSWRMMKRQNFLVTNPRDHKWAILHCQSDRMPYNKLMDLADMVLQNARIVNVKLEAKPDIRPFSDDVALDKHFADLKENKTDLVFVIIPNRGVPYHTIKQKAELKHGILTQCIKSNNVERRLNGQLIGNVLLKVNSKLNGTNHKIKDDPNIRLQNVMYLGADVTHPSPDQREIPSVVGVAASHDTYGACYNMQYRLQRSTVENIEDMESIVTEHLNIYRKYQKRYPDHIIYYRDGVSDGQFPIVKQNELRAINAACAKLKFAPKLTCIIVVKRHHTRFFPNGQPTDRNKFNNVEPGTIVDRVIVHPNEPQFFMVSHQSIQGTAKPTRYNIIEDTGNLDIDLLQQLTYNLCHMFPRCNRAVSYPAPAYLAHLVAARGRVYLGGAKGFRSPKEEYQKRLIKTDFLDRNPMYFV
ncbi:protein argonaute-2 [Scaptodrosophila lebanonensis]|uniref:Protein argonaute-2 n=1 Tax=Drosophila lebanonensis TaxID=7225 RepID=A0A6J2TF65_DROLE|nr:protein argonaute-2 [Scaptodrosophila lebanonensis]